MTDQEMMRQALELAAQGRGYVNPNPMVGALIVKDGTVIGQGFHRRFGGPHAERNALADCRGSPRGATLYVTLEPCCHWGKTPPCTNAILESGIRRVVTGSTDPNPLAAGKGVQILREHGVEVVEGVLREACDQLNRVYLHFMQTGRPYVVMKYAMTLDGKIATVSGLSKWVTGDAARQNVQRDRLRYTAIMAGVGTVLADDPALTCRLPGGRNPVRILCDTRLRTPLTARIITTARQARTILATCCNAEARLRPYREAGCEILTVPSRGGHVDLHTLMERLGEQTIDSILLEGGSALNWSALQSGIVNLVQAYISPKLFGGTAAKSPIGGAGVDAPCDAFCLSAPDVRRFGDDLLLESEVLPCSQES